MISRLLILRQLKSNRLTTSSIHQSNKSSTSTICCKTMLIIFHTSNWQILRIFLPDLPLFKTRFELTLPRVTVQESFSTLCFQAWAEIKWFLRLIASFLLWTLRTCSILNHQNLTRWVSILVSTLLNFHPSTLNATMELWQALKYSSNIPNNTHLIWKMDLISTKLTVHWGTHGQRRNNPLTSQGMRIVQCVSTKLLTWRVATSMATSIISIKEAALALLNSLLSKPDHQEWVISTLAVPDSWTKTRLPIRFKIEDLLLSIIPISSLNSNKSSNKNQWLLQFTSLIRVRGEAPAEALSLRICRVLNLTKNDDDYTRNTACH
jgi:hypothetical protein